MDEELGPVRAQAAYISLLQGDHGGASSSFAALLGQPVGPALHAVITNNLLCLRAMKSEAWKVCIRLHVFRDPAETLPMSTFVHRIISALFISTHQLDLDSFQVEIETL